MKKYILGTMILGMGLLTSCSLDETPASAFTEEEAYQSSTLVYVNTVANIYSAIGNKFYGSDGSSVHTLQEFTSDATMLPGRQGDWVDGGKWQNLFLHFIDPTTNPLSDNWNNLYGLIGLCNNSIDKLEELKSINEAATTYQYEVRAVRALCYYYLMDLFAQVPVVTSSKMSISDVAQSNRSDVFKFVVSELGECIPYLAEAQSQKTGEYYGRMTKAVAYMVMAKVALNAPVYTIDNTSATSYQAFVGDDKSRKSVASESLGQAVSSRGKSISITLDGTSRNAWETVIYCVDKITAQGYSLQANVTECFSTSNQSSVENIFTRPNDETTYRVEDYNVIRSLHYNHASALGKSAWNGACATVHEMNIFGYGTPEQDPRLSLFFFTGQDYVEQTGTTVDDGVGGVLEYLPLEAQVDYPKEGECDEVFKNAHVVKCGGARLKKYQYDLTSQTWNIGNQDLVIFRYADAVLMKAEAEYRNGTGDALADLNTIRERVGATPLTTLTLNDILNERMLELCWEGVRRQDQVRFCTFTQPTEDRFVGVWKNAVANNYVDDSQGYTNVYPIPSSVLSLNTSFKQNPGY